MMRTFVPRLILSLVLMAGLGCLDVGSLRGGGSGGNGQGLAAGIAGIGSGGGGAAGLAAAGASGTAGVGGAAGAGGAAVIGAPRLIAPLSTSRVTSQRPTLKWSLASGTDGVHIQICSDRTCTKPVTSFDAPGNSAAPPSALPAGIFFWRATGRDGAATGSALSATWELAVGMRSAETDTSWGSILDVNGDGYADAVVGEPQLGSFDGGSVYLYYGGASGLSSPATAVYGTVGSQGFGAAVASAGDVNGDGYGDLIVGAARPGGVAPGSVYLFLGGPAGLVATAAQSIDGDGQSFGYGASVSGVGDVNGDGYADVLVGAPYASPSDAGAAFLYLGGPSGLTLDTSFPPIGADSALGRYGTALSGAGDVNGDGFDDFLVGAPGTNDGLGLARLMLGNANAAFTSSIDISPPAGAAANSQFGASLGGADDVDGDGLADVIVGAPGAGTAGSAYLYLGSALAALQPNTTTNSTPAATLPGGFSVAGAGDVNSDGYADVVTGGPTAAWLFLGGSPSAFAGASSSVPQLLGGTAVAGAGDVNGDGYADVLTSLIGAVMVYAGSAIGLGSTPTTYIDPNATYDTFGELVAGLGDVNGDRFEDLAVGGSIYPGAAGGVSLSPSSSIAQTGLGPPSQDVAVGDVNGDHYDDAFFSVAGEFLFFPGGPQGLPVSTSVGFGSSDSLAGVGDVNHDGYPDFVIGRTTAGDQAEGEVALYAGGKSALALTPVISLDSPGPAGGRFGRTLAAAGDVNGDGFADVAASTSTGVYLYFGEAAGLPAAPSVVLTADSYANGGTILLAGLGDLDGDGYDDFLTSAGAGSNGALLFLGGPSGPSPTPSVTLDGPVVVALAGLGDVDGDGRPDFAIGGQDDTVSVYRGGTAADLPSRRTLLVGPAGSGFGPVARVGDVNGDGHADLLVGAPTLNEIGVAYVYYGSANGFPATPSVVLINPTSSGFGTSIY